MPDTNSRVVPIALGAVALVATTVAITLWLTRPAPTASVAGLSAPATLTPGSAAASAPAPAPPSAASPAAERGTPAAMSGQPQIQTMGERVDSAAPLTAAMKTNQSGTGIFINERELTPQMVRALVGVYRYPPPRGHFWYDKRSGLYGVWGHEAAGYIRPGHDFGPLAANASNGNTGTFINGREINQVELAFLQVLFQGQVQRGRVWLDGGSWNVGAEDNPIPIANLAVALQAAQQRARAGGTQWGWRDGSGAVMAGDGQCTMMAVPGAPVYSAGGC